MFALPEPYMLDIERLFTPPPAGGVAGAVLAGFPAPAAGGGVGVAGFVADAALAKFPQPVPDDFGTPGVACVLAPFGALVAALLFSAALIPAAMAAVPTDFTVAAAGVAGFGSGTILLPP
jgi:hypothetical protein